MSSLILKIIALLFMSIDHVGLVILNNNQIFRFFGRTAFPIYGFLLVEGFNHTKNDKKRLITYFISLFILSIISEPIHDLVLYNQLFYPISQNILFTLSTALLCMTILEKTKDNIFLKIISILIVIYISCLSEILFFNYGMLGILLIIGYYLISKINYKRSIKNLFYLILSTIYIIFYILLNGYSYTIFGVLLSLIPIYLYNTKKGYNSKIIKYLFYLYYPLHLLILYLINL